MKNLYKWIIIFLYASVLATVLFIPIWRIEFITEGVDVVARFSAFEMLVNSGMITKEFVLQEKILLTLYYVPILNVLALAAVIVGIILAVKKNNLWYLYAFYVLYFLLFNQSHLYTTYDSAYIPLHGAVIPSGVSFLLIGAQLIPLILLPIMKKLHTKA